MSFPAVLTSRQLREADAITLERQHITGWELMERAATACTQWISSKFDCSLAVTVVCGPGNNGGDGLAIARLLREKGYLVQVYVLDTGKQGSDCFLQNMELWKRMNQPVTKLLQTEEAIRALEINEGMVIDAIFGSGLNKKLSGLAARCVQQLNHAKGIKIAIDIPSGLLGEQLLEPDSVIFQADYTLSFQSPRLSFFFPESGSYTGKWEVLDIGLDKNYISETGSSIYYITKASLAGILPKRKKFTHKGSYGHARIMAGSRGKMGAAVLATQACLRSGAGLVSVQAPACGLDILQVSCPEAMVVSDKGMDCIMEVQDMEACRCVAAGPGLGTDLRTAEVLYASLQQFRQPWVLDADALNILSQHTEWLRAVPGGSILTPHPKEFERLAGASADSWERYHRQQAFSREYQVYLVLKGAHTCITTPEGETYFNTSGNPGMARGGSGDMLTGILAGLLAQGLKPLDTCLAGVFVHGCAGDLAFAELGETGMTVSDMIRMLPGAFDL